jgi:signal transduction histidine kinase
MRIEFRKKLTLSFLLIFLVFTAGIVVFVQQRARQYKTEALRERLDAYADAVSQYRLLYGEGASPDSLLSLMPPELRLTLIDRSGRVLFDSSFPDPEALENHADRPEVAEAVENGNGMSIRTSASNRQPYLYYAKDDGRSTIVRVAWPYDIRVRSFLKPDNVFLYFVIVLFGMGLLFILYVGNHFGNSARMLRDFSAALNSGGKEVAIPRFPKDEFGEVGAQLLADFDRISRSEKQLALEREKLLLHVQTSAEGVCFFDPDRKVAFCNGLFMQYFNVLYDGALARGRMLPQGCFPEASDFLDRRIGEEHFEARIGRHAREFLLRLNVFEDNSFEIILTDVTTQEKTRRLKQEMTGNIAHELRTPVTSIRGFLEIVLDNSLPGDKARGYLERAYSQTQTLSELISDMGLLARMDEKRDVFGTSLVDVGGLLQRVQTDTSAKLAEKNISMSDETPSGLKVRGNESLLYSVFRNLTDNVTAHAGENTRITVRMTGIADRMACFSFSDTGRGIPDESHLNRLFERFYRVNAGRTRETGGSGLGLSIVKNAVIFHGGTITARNRNGGGLEFLFTLPVVKTGDQ